MGTQQKKEFVELHQVYKYNKVRLCSCLLILGKKKKKKKWEKDVLEMSCQPRRVDGENDVCDRVRPVKKKVLALPWCEQGCA